MSRTSSALSNRWAQPAASGMLPTFWTATVTAAGVGLVILSVDRPTHAIAAAAALALAIVVIVHPPAAAYTFLVVTPLVVGIDRGVIGGPLRGSELLLGLLVAAVATRALWDVAVGGRWLPAWNRLDTAALLLVGAATVLPVLWLFGRQGTVPTGDLLYAAAPVKFGVVYALFRVAVRRESEVRRALWCAVAAATVVATVAVVQATDVLALPERLASLYAPAGQERLLEIGRGTSTLGSSIAVGDHLAFATAIVVAWAFWEERGRALKLALAVLFVVGTLASGQFSAVIALLTVLVVVGVLTGRARTLAAAAAPTALVATAAVWPVVRRRLESVDVTTGLPTSWSDRLLNLRTHFWPPLFEDGGFLLGVRPEARVPAPEQWRDWIWIESGHTWLLWTGGVPLLVAYLWFAWVALRETAIRARRKGPTGVAATAACAAVVAVFVLMTLDPHLTLRGSADLAFPLLALAMTGAASMHPRVRRTPC